MTQTSAATPSLLEDPKISEEVAAPAEAALAAGSATESLVAHDEELADFTRLETLLFARTRSHGSLQRELDRRERLFREALVRMSTSTSQEFSALRAGYDAAVGRAIEAEVARAELTFSLDETRAQLTAAAPSGGVGETPSVYARALDHSEQAFALEDALRRAGSERDALAAQSLAQRASFEALRGELSGVRARLDESEKAWLVAVGQTQKAHQRFSSTQDRISELRAESAELTLLAQTRAARIAELTQAAAFDQQEIRTLRAQVAAANAAQVAQGEAREADRQLWAERVQKHEEREQEAWKSAASAVARSETRLREFLGSLGSPLRELDASLDAINSPGAQPAEAAPTSFDVSPEGRAQETKDTKETKAASGPGGRRIADELAQERDRRTKLVAAVRALQAATQSGEPTKPWIEELVELVSESRPSARRRS